MSEELVSFQKIKLELGTSGNERIVFELSEFIVNKGEQIALVGPSGCGKSTLINAAIGLLKPDQGSIHIAGVDLGGMTTREMDRFRGATMGVVYQSLNLLRGFSALENILIGMSFGRKVEKKNAHAKAMDLLHRVGLQKRAHAKVDTLSGGELQRVAVARAVANSPQLIFADEPTGSLDPKTAAMIFELICTLSKEQGCTLIFVTHDHKLSDQMDRTFECSDLIQHRTVAS